VNLAPLTDKAALMHLAEVWRHLHEKAAKTGKAPASR
jgi:hypothetical protein